MILVDTSVWVTHLRVTAAHLQRLLQDQRVSVHPMVIGELACGNLRNRGLVLQLLRTLPGPPVASDDELLEFIESRRLMGRGIGYVDVHILASATLDPRARIWSEDRRLSAAASDLGLAYDPNGQTETGS